MLRSSLYTKRKNREYNFILIDAIAKRYGVSPLEILEYSLEELKIVYEVFKAGVDFEDEQVKKNSKSNSYFSKDNIKPFNK